MEDQIKSEAIAYAKPIDDEANEFLDRLTSAREAELAALRERAERAEAERDEALAKVTRLSPTSLPVSAREAARRRMRLDGADAQALEHAITMTERERDEARADDAKLGAAVRAVLDMFMWDHSTVRAEVESDRLAETVEGCIFVAIERAIRPADFVPAHAKASGGDS